jgi:hypothetical protein
MAFEIKKAKRELIWTKVALIAPSGGGKSYSALRLATGMKEELKSLGIETGILMGNTEGSRGRYYANEFDYDIVDIPVDSDPEDYVDFINYAVDQGYKILIMDSTSHEWKKALKIHQQNGGDFKAFAKVTPRHDKFLAAIADSPLHIIATIRGEDKYELEKNDMGKTTVKKLGVGGEQRKDTEYEFSLTFLIDQKTNFAETQKDNTHLFENRGGVLLTEEDGKRIIRWANSGEGYTAPVQTNENKEKSVTELQSSAMTKCQILGGSKNEKLVELLGTFSSRNPNKIKDVEELKKLNDELDKLSNN